MKIAITKLEAEKEEHEKMLGIATKGTKTKSRLPYLGKDVQFYIDMLPERLSITDKRCLIADIKFLEGKLDFKGEAFIEEYDLMSRDEKAKMVKRWLEAYEALKNKQ